MRRVTIGLALILLLTGTVVAETGNLDDLEATLQQEVGALVGDLDKAEKKLQKAYTKALALLARQAPDLKDELKQASKVAGKLRKIIASNFTLNGLVGAAVVAYRKEVQTVLDDLQALANGVSDPAGKAKIQKGIDKATAALFASGSSTDLAKALKGLCKALAKTKKPVKLLDKFGGGGGEPQCEGDALNGSFRADWIGRWTGRKPDGGVIGQFIGQNIDINVVRDPVTDRIIEITLTIRGCVTERIGQFRISISGNPTAKVYDVGQIVGGAFVAYGVDPARGTHVEPFPDGTFDLQTYDPKLGRLAGEMVLIDADLQAICATFNFTRPELKGP